MKDDNQRGRDEMNLAVLPIARLGRNDNRTKIEYYGTFAQRGVRKDMSWIVNGGANGLPTEFAERVMIALLHISAQEGFQDRKVYFTVYRVLKILKLATNNRNYKQVQQSLKQLVSVTISNEKAWYSKTKKKHIKTEDLFHIIDRVHLRKKNDDEDDEEQDEEQSFIVWSDVVWESIQAGYLKYLDLDFYYSLQLPLTRRLYRFLDKMMAYQDSYQIDINALANKLGMAPVEYPSRLKRPIQKAADEIITRGWLAECEFYKHGQFHRVTFRKSLPDLRQPTLFPDEEEQEITIELTPTSPDHDPAPVTCNMWESTMATLALMNPQLHRMLRNTEFVSLENGVLTLTAGSKISRLQENFDHNKMLTVTVNRAFADAQITTVTFVTQKTASN